MYPGGRGTRVSHPEFTGKAFEDVCLIGIYLLRSTSFDFFSSSSSSSLSFCVCCWCSFFFLVFLLFFLFCSLFLISYSIRFSFSFFSLFYVFFFFSLFSSNVFLFRNKFSLYQPKGTLTNLCKREQRHSYIFFFTFPFLEM